MSKRNTMGFSYKVEGVVLQVVDDTLSTTPSFVTKDIIEQINQKLKAGNFKVDESSLRSKYADSQLFIEGFAVEIEEPKTMGFMTGR
jgi:hypothetical protein